MNKLFILDGLTEGLLAVLENDSSRKCPFFDAIHTEQLNKDHTLEFSVPADHEKAAHVKENNLVAFKDEDGAFQLFQIYKTEEEHDGTELLTRAYAEHSFFEMVDDIIEDLRTVDGTADSAMTDALSKSRFKKGTVADLGIRTTNFYYESAVSSIQKIIQTWGGELKKRISFDGNSITGRFVDLLARRGADTGKRFEYTKDLLSIKKTVDISNLKTALYGRGKGEQTETGGYTRRITFENEEWFSTGIDPVDKPLGQRWVGDPEALEQFGRIDPATGQKRHRFGVFEDGEETDPAALLQNTWNALQSVNTPRITYEMSVIDLETVAGLSHEKVRLGDTVFVIDKEFTPALRVEARIIEIRRDLTAPENTEVILGNFLPMFTDLASRLKNVESKLGEKEGVWDEGGGPIDDTDFADITPAKPIVKATGAFSKVIIEWDADLRSYIREYEIYVSTVPAFTPDASNLVARTIASVFTYEGEPNQQYYVKVRGVNRADTAGPYSDEASAMTARLTTVDLDDLMITAEKLAAGAVGNDALDRSSENKIVIGAADIADLAVGEAAIAALAVNTAHIKDLAVTNAKIADLAVNTAKIADAAITNAKISSLSADKITTGYLSASRMEVKGFPGANIQTAEIPKFSDMKAYWVNSGTWYSRANPKDFYLINYTHSGFFNRPSPEEGDEILIDFDYYSANGPGTITTVYLAIEVFFNEGGSYYEFYFLDDLFPIVQGQVANISLVHKIPTNAYAGKTPRNWEIHVFTNRGDTPIYCRNTDVRLRIRGNLIVQGDIEAKNITAWEGLNVNNQFTVDANGNVKFAGILEAGISINSPTINSGRINMYGLSAIFTTANDPNAITDITEIYNGAIHQNKYKTPGDTANVRTTILRSGRLNLEVGSGLRGTLRENISYSVPGHLLPYEYKYESGNMIVESGLIAAELVGLNNVLSGSATGYPLYLHADRLGIGTHKTYSTDPEYKGLILDIREKSAGSNSAVITSPNGMELKTLNSGRVTVLTADGGKAEFMGISGHDGIRMADRAILKWLGGSDWIQVRTSTDGAAATLEAIIVNVSDRRLKRNIEAYEESALDKVVKSPVYKYNMKGHADTRQFMGLITDEAPEEIVLKAPEEDMYESIDLYHMSAILWKAVQELQAKLERNGIQ